MNKIVVCASLLISAAVSAQGTIFVPDNAAGVGTCNAFPFNNAAFTYAARVPASFLDPLQTLIDDVAFAPCSTGFFQATALQMGIGHVPTPLPVPFTFPTFDVAGNVTALGSFIDFQPIWNTVSQGPFTWNYTLNTWSPLGFAGLGGTGFVWNGTSDIAFFITFSGGSGGPTCHRTSTEPFRVYTSGVFQAGASTGSGASGFKMELFTRPAIAATVTPVGTGCPGTGSISPALSSSAFPVIGNLLFHVDVSQGPPGATALLYLSIGLAPAPLNVGFGCNAYLDLSTMLALVGAGLLPLGPVVLDTSGIGIFPVPVPPDPTLAGVHVGFQAVILDAGAPLTITLTNALDALLNP